MHHYSTAESCGNVLDPAPFRSFAICQDDVHRKFHRRDAPDIATQSCVLESTTSWVVGIFFFASLAVSAAVERGSVLQNLTRQYVSP